MKINVQKMKIFLKLCSFFCLITLLLILLYQLGYRINLSNSLPYWIYKTSDASGRPISIGDFVVINYSLIPENPAIKLGLERKYLTEHPMLKQIGAIPGDTVSLKNNRIYVNNTDTGAMIVLSADSQGEPLSSFPTPVMLQPEQFWLISDPERGFDSRYFGWIDRVCITHVAMPIF